MGCFGRKACISAAIFTLVEAVIWTSLSIVGLLVYYCAFDVEWNDFTIQYFNNADGCHKDLGIVNIPAAKKTGFILIYYTIISLLWIATSLVMLGGARRKLTGLTFYPWFVTVIITLLSDVAVMILFVLDMNEELLLSKNVAICMAVVSIRVGFLWLINIIVLRLAHKFYLLERDGDRHTKKVADGPELPTSSNWTFAADHIRPNGKNQFGERETPYKPFSPVRQDRPNGQHMSPITDPIVEEPGKRLGEPNRSSPYRREPSRDESSGWNLPHYDRERWNGPPKSEALAKPANQRGSPYRMEPEGRDGRSYTNGPNKRMTTTPHYNDQNRLRNYEPGRRNVPHNGGQEWDDMMYHNRPHNDGHIPQNTAQNDERRRRNGDHRDDSLRRDHRPHALSGIASGGRRNDIKGDWENFQVHDKPQRRDDHRNNRENAPLWSEVTVLHRKHSASSDADSGRSEELKRLSNTIHPKGVQNQYPWSYVLPQINSAVALKKKQLKPITDDKVDDEEKPPVPVPDYTLHFNRQFERPVLNRTSSDASSQPRY